MENEKTRASYYAIIPARVRYDDKLTYFEMILYGEIVALSNKLGYCYASNDYFAWLYKKDQRTISRAVNNLSKCGHIVSDIEKSEGNQRRLYIAVGYQAPPPIDKNVYTPIDKIVHTLLLSIDKPQEKEKGAREHHKVEYMSDAVQRAKRPPRENVELKAAISQIRHDVKNSKDRSRKPGS